MEDNLEVRAENGNWYFGINFMVCKKEGDQFYAAKSIELQPIKKGARCEPTFRLSRNQAQTLMDDLWHCGLRPGEGIGNQGQLQATQDHLKDMRQLVFKTRDIINNP